MAKIRDRTEDFKDAIRSKAHDFGYTESQLAAVLASFILHKVPQRSQFTKAAIKTLESINELENFIVKHRKDYVDLRRTTEQERDNIEHEVSIFVKTCKDQIDILKNRIYDEEKNGSSTRWLHMRDTSADVVAHRHGVVLILSERLHTVTAQFDKLRSIRFQDAVNRAMPRRKMPRVGDVKSVEASKSDFAEVGDLELPSSSGSVRLQDQLLDDETRALQVELTSLLDAVQETETKMVEMSALNHLMSTHVLQQAQQIEYLYEQAVEATNNVELGNKELSQAIRRNSSSRTFLLLFLFVLTFSILFLDWYS
ncbi:syntaxin-81 isoform X1 [Iris pallida]|uniref:Syntaxin-81 isoform X1 n=1 Tax=Iris pallida TaxID=29817 RepID=A0AAX6E500_IRIPA|nr:syntaxin-81 isoform X1 [Iris pallida]